MKKVIWIVILLVIIVSITLLAKKEDNVSQPFKIGFVGSLTGDLKVWGEESRDSIALAVKEINATGGIKGRSLEVIFEDGACNAAKAVSSARKLIDVDKVKVVIAFCSQEAFSIAPVALENKIIEFVPAATIPELTNINEYVFRTSPSDKKAAEVLSEIANSKHSKLAIITENNDYSKSLRNHFLSFFDRTKVVFDESYDPGSRDFRSLIAKVKSVGADSVLVNANTTVAAGLIVKQMAELGLLVPSYGVYFGSDPEFINIAGKASEGFTYVEFIADNGRESVRRFLESFRNEYGYEAPHPQFAALSYDAPFVLKRAIEAVGDDPEDLKIYFKNLKEIQSVLGTFDIENGDIHGAIFKVRKIIGGKPVTLTE